MKMHYVLLHFILGYALLANAAVEILTDSNFDSKIESDVWLIKFYAPWCGHCKSLAPTFGELSNSADFTAQHIRMGKVDCTEEKSTCARFGIRGFPTLKAVTNGKYYEYSSARTKDAMHAFITGGYLEQDEGETLFSAAEKTDREKKAEAEATKLAQESEVEILTNDNFVDKVEQGRPGHKWLIKFYAPWCGHCKRLSPMWDKLSINLNDVENVSIAKVDCTVHRRICTRFGVGGYPTLLFIKDSEYWKYAQARTMTVFQEFVETGYESVPSLGPLPQASLIATAVDYLIEWAVKHTYLAAGLGLLFLIVFVAMLVMCLDYCMGDELDTEVPNAKPKAD